MDSFTLTAYILMATIFVIGVVTGYAITPSRTFPKYDRRRIGQFDRRGSLRRVSDINTAKHRAHYGLIGSGSGA